MRLNTIPVQAVMDLGLIPITQGGHAQIDPIQQPGRNAAISTALEDIWDGGGVWVAPTVTRIHDIVSTDANDTLAGTGAQTVEVKGLDTDWEPQSETVNMAGAVDSPTLKSYLHVYQLTAKTFGSGAVNAGTITATAQTDATVTAQMTIGLNYSQSAIFPVRAGYTAHVLHLFFSRLRLLATVNLDVRLLAQPDGGGFEVRWTGGITNASSSGLQQEFKPPLVFPEKTIIKLDAISSAASADVSAGFGVLLVKN